MDDKSLRFSLSESAAKERSFMSQVYLWMAMGLGLRGIVAGWIASNPSMVMALARNSMSMLVLVFVQFGIVMWLSSQIMKLSLTTATIGFSIYATMNGVLFSTIFLIYTSASIASTFIVTAGTFGIVSIYGFTTKRDLTSMGSFCFMGLIGIILASVVNWFFKSPMLYWMITYIGIAIFIGLTAYDTQKLKQIHEQGIGSGEVAQKIALLGALKLYLDFINLFLLLLRVMGRRR